MDTKSFLQHLESSSFYQGQIVHIEHIPSAEPSYGEAKAGLHPSLKSLLVSAGLLPLYAHQAAAFDAVSSGGNVMVSTPSASGKTLCYNLPVLNTLLEEKKACALYLFPTKALSQDQLRALTALAVPQALSPGECAIFDGDTPEAERPEIRRRARILLTNPDMLHLGILPHHRSWSRLLRRLRYVVVDEAHVYRGVFGSHVSLVLRRLRRLCDLYGSAPQFVCCSATIANAREHAEELAGLPFVEISQDGSPHGAKEFVFWNPPALGETMKTRRSSNSEATNLFTELVGQNIRTLAFARTRRLTELIYVYSRQKLLAKEPTLAARIKPYRAGYLPADRRHIEQQLFRGELVGAIATNAMELGVDIGMLEATVLAGYPGSISSTWQQAGRSGRRGASSISFLVATDDPLDQYLMRHPEYFLGQSPESALIDPSNPHILKAHLLCAAWEFPLRGQGERHLPPSSQVAADELAAEGKLKVRNSLYYPSPRGSYPAHKVNLRSTSAEVYYLINTISGDLLETVEANIAFSQLHPGAIYLHQGETYLVTALDLASRCAYAAPNPAPYYTQAKELTEVTILRKLQDRAMGSTRVSLGELEVTTTVVGFRRKAQFSEEVLGEEDLSLPPRPFQTVGLWLEVPPSIQTKVTEEGLDLLGGLHAAEHAAIALLPLFALCHRNDIGGLSTPYHADTGEAEIFIYDAHPGGIGIAERGFAIMEKLLQATLEAVAACHCQDGCPSCVQSPKCGNNNQPLDKAAAAFIIRNLIADPQT